MDMKRKPVFQCPVNATLHVIGGRWKILVIYQLAEAIARKVYGRSRETYEPHFAAH